MGEGAKRPDLGAWCVQRLLVGQIDIIPPAAFGFGQAEIADRPGHRELRRGNRSNLRRDGSDAQVGQGRLEAEDVDGAGFVVVVVEFVRIIRVEIAGQRVFQDDVVGIAPGCDVVGARADIGWQIDLGHHVVELANGQRTAVLHGADQDGAVAACIRPGLVARQPDRIGPVRARGSTGTLVGHGVTHFQLRAFDSLDRRHDSGRHQVGQRIRLDIQRHGRQVVAIVGILVERAAAIRLHQQEDVAAITDRNHHRDRIARVIGKRQILLAGRQRGAVLVAAEQEVIAGQLVVQRQVDIVAPMRRIGGHRALVDDLETQRSRRAGGYSRRCIDVGNLDI